MMHIMNGVHHAVRGLFLVQDLVLGDKSPSSSIARVTADRNSLGQFISASNALTICNVLDSQIAVEY